MIKILVLVLNVATGGTAGLLSSNATYPTMEACEAARPAAMEKLQQEIDAKYPGVYKIGENKCVVMPPDAK